MRNMNKTFNQHSSVHFCLFQCLRHFIAVLNLFEAHRVLQHTKVFGYEYVAVTLSNSVCCPSYEALPCNERLQ